MAMITETARVAALDADGYAWLETDRRTACDSCSVQQGCGSGVLSKMFSGRRTRLRVANTLGARVNDQVLVGIDDRMLVRASLATYFMPLVWMLLGAIAGSMAGGIFEAIDAEGASAVGGLAGLGIGFMWLRGYARRSFHQPQLIGFADEAVVATVSPDSIGVVARTPEVRSTGKISEVQEQK
jgi:sigma-E factor negative regulatory protein RseC